jgi:transposase
MEMCAPYILEAKARVPQAEIAFDPFHVVKLANEAVHDVRRTEARERKGSTEAGVLKGSRWALLKAPESLRAKEHVRLSAVAGLNARLYRAYPAEGGAACPLPLRPALGVRAPALLALLGEPLEPRPLREARPHAPAVGDGILAAIRLRLSNGRMEGLNNKIGVIKHRAQCFHSFAALAAMVFLCCTDLQLNLPFEVEERLKKPQTSCARLGHYRSSDSAHSLTDVLQVARQVRRAWQARNGAQILIDGPQVMVSHVLEIEPRHDLQKGTIEWSWHAAWVERVVTRRMDAVPVYDAVQVCAGSYDCNKVLKRGAPYRQTGFVWG